MEEQKPKLSAGQIIGVIFLITFLHFTYVLFDETGLLKVARLNTDIKSAELELNNANRQNAILSEKAKKLIEDPMVVAQLKSEILPVAQREHEHNAPSTGGAISIEAISKEDEIIAKTSRTNNESGVHRESKEAKNDIDSFLEAFLKANK